MDQAQREGLAAVINFQTSLLQVLCLVLIIGHWFQWDTSQGFYRFVQNVTSPLLRPATALLRWLRLNPDWAPMVVLFLSVPVQFVLVHEIRGLTGPVH